MTVREEGLRCLLYTGRAYEQLVEEEARYKTKLVKIPTPEFYTFYNGQKDYPLEEVLSLSDAYIIPAGDNSIELKVNVININSGKMHEILGKCKILREYSVFIDTVRKYSNEKDAIKRAINECIEKGILADYLRRKGMLLTAKIFRAIKQNLNLTNEQIAEETGCTVQDVEDTRRMFGM